VNLQKCEKIAREFLQKFNLKNWDFFFDRAKVRLGACHFAKNKISISREFAILNSEKICRDLILHEIAHALCGPKTGHGKIFKKKLEEIGGKNFSKKEVRMPARKFTAFCENCGANFQTQKQQKIACRKCCRKFSNGKFCEKFVFKFLEN
jgi:predicted SprT family Zn-dependent metalloprotease